MKASGLKSHPRRYELVNELHARPFPELRAPCRAAFLAIKDPENAAQRDPAKDRAHLLALLDRFGADHPPPEAEHYYGRLGNFTLRWERHTEFVSYTAFLDGVADPPFSNTEYDFFPKDWLATAPGKILTSALVRVEEAASVADFQTRLNSDVQSWFVRESMAAAFLLEQNVMVVSDFRIDMAGHVRFFVMGRNGIGIRRLGRVVQRLLEIETYKSLAMLSLPQARSVSKAVADLDQDLSLAVQTMSKGGGSEDETLERLLKISAKLEVLSSDSSFRFGAAGAYNDLVHQRIAVLRETRIEGKQLFSEFMMRRFEPAMRTCRSAHERLTELSGRAAKAADLLSTRVSVATAAQNRELLHRMDERAALQLRLQETVEGLSVVAISYYAISLLSYFVAPFAEKFGWSKKTVIAAAVVPMVLLVWWMIRRIKSRLGH